VVISHEHRYVFVELTHTASAAIRAELCQHYAGEPILAEHSTYRDFLKVATEEEKDYFVFSCVRNPMDIAVTKYFKHKTGHKYRNPSAPTTRRSNAIGHVLHRRIGRFVRDGGADFETFFLRLFRLPYNSWACLDHRKFDFVIRFENIEADFEGVLRRIGIEPVRTLPRTNSTREREKDFLTYYRSPRVIERAKRVFAIYMEEWGYEFPESWGAVRISRRDRVAFAGWSAILKLYWLYFKPWVWGADMRSRQAPQLRPA
jgi:Sulfotransferase family